MAEAVFKRTRVRGAAFETVARIARYMLWRVVMLSLTVVVGVYLAILVANMGGYVDQIREAQIREGVGQIFLADPELQKLSPEERQERYDQMVELERKRLGLDRPFIVRSFSFLKDALSLDLGRAEYLESLSGSKRVRLILLERLPATLVLWGTGNLVLFFCALFIALFLSRRYGSFLDRAIIALAPTSAAPAWFYGIFFILIFAAILKILPFGGMVEAPPPKSTPEYALSLLKHLVLPVAAIIISSIFIAIYNLRTFFLIYSSEDYVEMAKAKGLPSSAIERRYILRPTLPTIITNFALMLISMWMGGIVTETIFNWPGLGKLVFQAIGLFDSPVIVGSIVIYAYLLALTVLLLDIIYALVDPRVKVGGAT